MKKRIRENDSVNYWKSMVDVITTLMMVILLVLMFFILNFLVNNQENEYPDDDYDGYEVGYGYEYNPYDADETLTPTPTPTVVPDDDAGGGGGGETTPTTVAPTDPTEEFVPEGAEKAAIYVVLIDEETGQTVEVSDVFFELYNAAGSKQTLTTHYPNPISYTEFETTEGGWFYLPEKVRFGNYYLHQITEIPGYDFSSDTYFEVEESHEWDQPLVVRVLLGASKNNIQVQINDATTGVGLDGVTFDVVADGDVITPDGSVRYLNGEVVDSIQCDETGYGLGQEIYLGNYILVPRSLPFGYAAPELSSRQIELPRRTAAGAYAPLTILESDMTTVRVTVTDELDENIFIAGMTYVLTCNEDDSEDRLYVTNTAGYFEVTGLKKNATYRLVESEIAGGYLSSDTVLEFTVDSMGYIESVPVFDLNVTNRMIRVEINTIDRVLKVPLSGYTINLIDQNGNTVYSWISDATSYSINGIETGIYTLEVENSDDKTIIVVEDVKDIQKFSSTIMTSKSYITLACVGAIIVVILVFTLGFVAPKQIKKRRNKEGTGNS